MGRIAIVNQIEEREIGRGETEIAESVNAEREKRGSEIGESEASGKETSNRRKIEEDIGKTFKT